LKQRKKKLEKELCVVLMSSLSYVTAEDVEDLLKSNASKVAILDVRDEERKEDGHIAGSVHFPSATFWDNEQNVLEAIKGKVKVVVHCSFSQQRGPTCARHLSREWLQKLEPAPEVLVLYKGFNNWSASGHDVCYCQKDEKCDLGH